MDLFYEVQGEGDPIVMIHSPGVDSREWKYIAPLLAKSYKVVTYDGRGTGRSPAPHAPLDLVQDLKNLLDHLNFQQAVLIGHSMGGQAAVDFALTYPARVNRLVLIAATITGFPFSQEYVEWNMKVNSFAPDADKMIEFSLSGPVYRVAMSSPEREFLYAMHADYMKKVLTEWKSFEIHWPQPPAIERLEDIAAGILYIHGDADWKDIFNISEEFKRATSFRQVMIKGADHMLTLTHAERISEHILQFLEE